MGTNSLVISVICIAASLALEPSWAGRTVPFVPVCDRSPAVRDAIVLLLTKPCLEISEADLQIDADINPVGPSLEVSGDTVDLKPGDFSGMSGWRELRIQSNKINVARGTFKGVQARRVVLWTNADLQVNPSEFDQMPQLDSLVFGAVWLQIRNAKFGNLPKLRDLTLFSNTLLDVPPAIFSNLKNLTDLFIGYVGRLDPEVLVGLENVKRLNMRISVIEADTFRHVTGIELLGLSESTDLDLIPDSALQNLPALESVDVGGAPLRRTRKAAFRGKFTVRGLPANFDQDNEEWGRQ